MFGCVTTRVIPVFLNDKDYLSTHGVRVSTDLSAQGTWGDMSIALPDHYDSAFDFSQFSVLTLIPIGDIKGGEFPEYIPSLQNLILSTMNSRRQITDRQSFEAFRHPAFVQAVNRAANLKCIEAINSGKLRVVDPRPSSTPCEYTPRMDLIDDPAVSILTAVFELPGIKTNDISLHILDGRLVVSGERRPTYSITQQSEEDTAESGIQAPKMTVPIQELRYGTFRRAVRIPEGLKESEVKASVNEGMLTVTWPRIPAAAVRTRRPHSSSPPSAGTALQ